MDFCSVWEEALDPFHFHLHLKLLKLFLIIDLESLLVKLQFSSCIGILAFRHSFSSFHPFLSVHTHPVALEIASTIHAFIEP